MAELLILGSGVGVPNPKRATPAYILNVEDKNILIESGSGTLQRLIKQGITYQDIDYVLYSHLHPDHTLDFTSLLFAAKHPKNPRRKDLKVIGPEGIKDFYNKLLVVYGTTITPEHYRVLFDEIDEGELDLGICRILIKELEHTDSSIGFRIEFKDGKVLVYSGDTDYCPNLISLSKDADVLILESSAPDEFKVKGHLTPSVAGKVATEAGCKTLILTHLYPICDQYPILKQCRKSFKGKVILARDNMRLKL